MATQHFRAVDLVVALTNPFTDFSLTGPGTTTEFTRDGKLKFEFPATDNAAFFRIELE